MEEKKVTLTQIDEVANFEKLAASFSCGDNNIDDFLRHSQSKYATVTNTFILWNGLSILGFFTLQNDATSIERRYRKNHDFGTNGFDVYPTLLISFFAIDQQYQNQGWGSALMNVLFEIAYSRRKLLGAYTLLTVESVKSALDFYSHFGFESYERPNNRDHTFLGVTIDEIGQFLESQSQA